MIPRVTIEDRPIDGRANARHTIFGIRIWRGARHFEAVLAQERFEWWFLRRWGATIALPVLLAAVAVGMTAGPLEGTLFAPLVFAAFLLGPRIGPLHRRMELIGHAVEWIVAVREGTDRARYLRDEARALARYDQFAGWGVERIELTMLELEPVAQRWVDRNASPGTRSGAARRGGEA